jgi:hypothetical protein
MTTSQIIGATIGNTAEVEANSLAMRGTLRPEDVGALGHYSVGGTSGLMAAGIAAGIHTGGSAGQGTIFAWRWGDATRLALVHKVIFSAGNDVTAFTAGIVQFNLFLCRGFTASFTGGTSLAPTSNMNKLRTTGFGTSLLTDSRISTTAQLTVPTTLPGWDGSPTASLICGVPATAGATMIPPTPMIDQRPGEHPFVFAVNEGFTIETGGIAIAATGTWKFSVTVHWSEVTAYP